ncbi:MAG: twin-arginine translocation signal domain-containing protein [Patescibacteria group bacterium]|nr:twin-arginine translocation signal domain-containing protein [Patescibacteria group bacterium]
MKRRNFLKTVVGGTGLGLGATLLITTKNSNANSARNPAFSITNYGQYSF